MKKASYSRKILFLKCLNFLLTTRFLLSLFFPDWSCILLSLNQCKIACNTNLVLKCPLTPFAIHNSSEHSKLIVSYLPGYFIHFCQHITMDNFVPKIHQTKDSFLDQTEDSFLERIHNNHETEVSTDSWNFTA